jgi:hypothetical protein
MSAAEVVPGECRVVCRNTILADERACKREKLLKATEQDLDVIVLANQRGNDPQPLRVATVELTAATHINHPQTGRP